MTPQEWMRRLCGGDIASILQLYAPDAVLVPTYSDTVLQGHAQLARYFQTFTQKAGLCGDINTLVQQVPADNARVYSGIYTFTWQEWRQRSVRARYTFVVVGNQILTHHSSEMPP